MPATAEIAVWVRKRGRHRLQTGPEKAANKIAMRAEKIEDSATASPTLRSRRPRIRGRGYPNPGTRKKLIKR